MSQKQMQLLTNRRFFPLFITQLFQAFNDCAFKSAMSVLIAYRLTISGFSEEIMIALAGGLFILPFFLFSATAGLLADKYEKAYLIRAIKFFEIFFVLMGAIGFVMGSVGVLLTTLFLMGTHSAFFGPLKYAILPDHLQKNELIRGNALIEASTFVSILLGTIVGTKLILSGVGIYVVSILMLSLAVLGWVSSLYIPKTNSSTPELKVSPNIFRDTWDMVQHVRDNRTIFVSIIGISWFWLVGATFLQQFFTFTKDALHAGTGVTAMFQMVFTIGIAIGSLLCNKMLEDEINAKYVPLSVLGISFFIFDLSMASTHFSYQAGVPLQNTLPFLKDIHAWRMVGDVIGMAICGGFYVVPLYALMQTRSKKHYRSRTIASNNIINSLFMVLGAAATTLLLSIHFTVPQVFVAIGFANIFFAVYLCKLLPQEIRKSVLRWVLSLAFKVKVNGMENYMQAGDRLIIVANHTSLLDIMLISAFLPDHYTIAVNKTFARKWWVQPFISLVEVDLIDPSSPLSTKEMVRKARAGTKYIIFPEGLLTSTGSLMKLYEAPGMIADKANASVLPVQINGANHTVFSRMKGKAVIKWFPSISLNIRPAQRFNPEGVDSHRQRRRIIANQLYTLITDMIFASSEYQSDVFSALLEARRIHGGQFSLLEDTERKPLTYNQFIARTFILGRAIAKQTSAREHVGVMLPTTIAGAVTFFALQAYGRTPAMLNFSAGARNILSACETGQVKTIYTSKKFIGTAKLEEVVKELKAAGLNVVYLESFRKTIKLAAKLRGLLTARFAKFAYRSLAKQTKASDKAVILFTSGSEGSPKGVVLSHQNLVANCNQMLARIDFTPADTMFNALPIFHCFGLTAGTILPILKGIPTFLYPSPLHYRIVPELVYNTGATIFFGTDTFLTGYARYAHPYDFYNVRFIFAGAEKLKPETSQLWAEKFGVRIFEGYGATETAPVIATNTPLQNEQGTVGCFLPGIQHKLEAVEGIHQGGRLLVSGPNIMLGYIDPKSPGTIMAPEQGWYDTGDIVYVDEEGYIRITGRAKRFAKIGGEMISLTAVELYVKQLWPDYQHATTTLPDPKKGEQIILLTENPNATRDAIVSFVKDNGLSELSIPRKIIHTSELPVMATGKVNYPAVHDAVVNAAG